MADGADRRLEQVTPDGVVHIDDMLVRVEEFDFAQDIPRPRRLGEGNVRHVHAVPIDAAGIDCAAVVFHL